jgi:hypothetical protein
MDSQAKRRYTWRHTEKCPRAVDAAGGVATKGIASMRTHSTAGRCPAQARHAAPSTLYLGVGEPRRP